MAKLYLSELSAVLAEKHGIDRRTAQRFVTSVVAVVQSGIEADRMVKIKGLGTFKIIDVGARESVNVNTGERLVIDSHSKLTFLPDNAMKELVNKPFSQFETVVLNDGVEFDDATDTSAEEEEFVTLETEEEEPVVSVVEEDVDEETPSPVDEQDEKAVPEKSAETIVETEELDELVELDEPEETKPVLPPGWKSSDDDDDEVVKGKKLREKKFGWGHLAVAAMLALLVGVAVGYMLGRENGGAGAEKPQPQVAQATAQQPPQTTEEQPVEEEETEVEPQEMEDTTTPIWEKYNDMDPRTRNGFYYITGLDHIEKAKAGDNTVRIARRVFFAPELACYIEVFNGINGSTVLEEGTEVKIPVIEPKKSVKKRLEQQNNQ